MEGWNRKYPLDSSSQRIFLIIIVTVCMIALFQYNTFSGGDRELRERYNIWKTCINDAVGSLDSNQFWIEIGKAANSCQPLLKMETSRLSGYQNRDEIKYHLLPIDSSSDSVIISLGIGGDVEAEKKLKPHLTKNSVFVGTDPDIANHDVYKQVGTYLPMTVGNQSGNITVDTIAVKGGYTAWNTFMITLPTLLKEYLPKNTEIVDDVWVDIEYSEYKIFDYFTSKSEIFKDGYSICQWNVEIHNPSDEQKKIFHSFIKQAMLDERYAFLNVVAYWGHWRMFFLDFKDGKCANKYLLD